MSQSAAKAVDTPPRQGRPTSYENDLYGWVGEQVALLRTGRVGEIDAENIAEELDVLARSEFGKLRSALRVLVMHMLKWDQQPEHRTPSWMFSIREQRRRYHEVLEDSPSLKPRRDEALARAYPGARDWAANETHLAESEFPTMCPYTWEDILDRPFESDPK